MTPNERTRVDELGYDSSTGFYHLHHDWESSEPLSYTVMHMILALTGGDSMTSTPLAESIDPDAIDQLLEHDRPMSHPHDRLTFSHEGCTVTVQRDGHVFAAPPGVTGHRDLVGSERDEQNND
ncbi:HalOD1 output domain-containing protein [Natronomonas amylolytica]|uniref:HalOD1 output domain-containing protein n=1 Tax=Natronomonas amylolytica TaxID=3108498 RepID=UPI00300ADDCC